jgi:hypothetical protein
MARVIGISVSKCNLILQGTHMALLQSQNIGIKESALRYILYYNPVPYTENKEIICHLKGLLTRIRSDEIYDAYNDDFGVQCLPGHELNDKATGSQTRTRPLIKIKMNRDFETHLS